ncbi:MAG: HEPN domain-containing protein [Verrucomicrobia bacterium]|nr:HEPN domain-containing protein [Verrucomicrobiota bacterium]
MVTAADSPSLAETLRLKAQPVIEEATRRLVAEFQAEQIWLFGSYAWGESTEDSDLDLAVVVRAGDESTSHLAQRAHGCLNRLELAKDVLVYRDAEFNRYRHAQPSLMYQIVHEGRLLHGEENGQRLQNGSTLELNAELAQTWLCKAKRGLKAAELLGTAGDLTLEAAVHHCELSYEQTLKAYLTIQNQPMMKTHDLKTLIEACSVFDETFQAYATYAAELTRRAVSYREPGDLRHPALTRADFSEALASARRIYDFVISVLSAETHPVQIAL